jgi:hypothetical protein
MNRRFSEGPQFSYTPWPRRYLIFGPVFAILQIILFFALFIFGIGLSDSIPPHTPWKDRTIDAIDVILMAMFYPLHFIGTGSTGLELVLMALNALLWGLCAVGIWHALAAIVNKDKGNMTPFSISSQPAISEMGPGIGRPVMWLYRTSGSKSTSLGHTTVPISGFTLTCAKNCLSSKAANIPPWPTIHEARSILPVTPSVKVSSNW